MPTPLTCVVQFDHPCLSPLSRRFEGLWYFGIYIMEGTPAAAYFSAMVTFFNTTQPAPAMGNGNISLSTRLLSVSDPLGKPTITASWYTIPRYHNYTFYKLPHGCGLNPRVNELSYFVENGTPFKETTVFDPYPFYASAVLSDFEDDIDAFCINLIAKDELGRPVTCWMAQTVYYPHVRDGSEPEPVNIRTWTPGVWTAIVITSLLFVGAPIGIISHRIWLSRRRAHKRRAALLESHHTQTWIN